MSRVITDAYRAEGHAQGFAEGVVSGITEGRKADIQRALHLRLGVAVPFDVVGMLREMKDLEILNRWFDAALTAPNIQTFRLMMEKR
jgi:hypothetical protein